MSTPDNTAEPALPRKRHVIRDRLLALEKAGDCPPNPTPAERISARLRGVRALRAKAAETPSS